MAVAAPARPAAAHKSDSAAAPRAKGRARPRAATPFGGGLQAKLALGPVRDSYEREADSAAAHVVGNRPGAPSLSALPMAAGSFGGLTGGTALAQRACPACAKSDEDRKGLRIQRKCACGAGHGEPCSCDGEKARKKKEEEHPELQIDRLTKRDGAARPADPLGAVQSVVRTPGRPLPDPVRADMEQGFGRSFGHVRIHDNTRAAASAEAIGAHAYTVGNHIAFNRGQYHPGTDSGRFLLAHELAHTVQQSGAPAPQSARISQPGDRHEAQADRAANAALGGGPMPALSPGATPISRYSIGEFGDDLLGVGEAVLDAPGALYDAAGNVVEGALDLAGDVLNTVTAIARAVGGAISRDGATIVISVPKFDPCPELEFDLSLSDLGLDPTLKFPVVAGGLGIGIVNVVGVLGVEANLDPGFGFRLDGCQFGPGEIRISPLSLRTTVSGQLSVTGASMVKLGGDLGATGDLYAVIAWPEPPFVLAVPLVGLALGGTYQFMLQAGGTITGSIRASAGLRGISAANKISGDVGVGLDLAYGLYGSLSVLGAELCRLGWPLDSIHKDAAASFSIAASFSVGTSGLSFSFGVSATPMPTNPLDDLGFAFDASRLEDDCRLCEFLTEHGLMPSQNGYNWANPGYQASLPILGGPRRNVFKRDPGLTSGSLCRGTCGINCPEGTCNDPRDLVLCQNRGDRHVWHTYVNYATCGAHQGCKDHDACYDMAADMPIWGFGGYMIGPMYRACDLDALCGYSFKQAVTWAVGGGPYDSRLRYADERTVTPGCLGRCPQNIAEEGEPEIQQTCLQDRELWSGLQVGDSWGKEFFNKGLFKGFVKVPYIVGVHYGVNAAARIDADASAQLGPINLQNACLIYDPVTMTYTGTADLSLFLNGRASASITASLEGFLSDFLCLLNWVTLRGTMKAGVAVQLPTFLTAGVDLYCANGDLEVLPRVGLKTCVDIFGQIEAGLDVFLLSINVWSQEWPLIKKQIEKCWELEFKFDPFIVGTMPNFDLESSLLAVETLLGALFEPAQAQNRNRTPARSPLPAPARLLFPCLRGDDDDNDDNGGTENCPRKAEVKDSRNLLTPSERRPTWGPTRNVSIPGGGSAAVATTMEAKFLDKDISGGSETTGSVQKGIYKHRGLPTAGCFTQTKKDSQHFIKGHLLNAKIGGPGTEEKNLFPITALANARHKTSVEQGGEDVVRHVNAGDLMYYKVTVQNPSAPREIMNSSGAGTGFFEISATFLCEVADYKFCENNTLKRNSPTFVPVPSQFIFHPSGGDPFDQITDPNKCKR